MADQDFEAAAAELRKALDERLSAYLNDIRAVFVSVVADHEDRPRLSLVRNVDDGSIYAYGPGQFDHISSMEELEYGRNIGIYSRAPWLDTDTAGVEVFRGIATEGSGAAK